MNLQIIEPPQEILRLIMPSKQTETFQSSQTFLAPLSYSGTEVTNMLSALNPDMPYDDWIKIGMALHSEGHDCALWEDWSAKGGKYTEGECRNKWDSFHGSSVSMGSLVHMAKNAGWKSVSSESNFVSTRQELKIYHWSSLNQLPDRKYLIKGWLEKGAMSVVFGASNSGKTFLALDIACHIALGWPWRGNRVRKSSVVYIASEGGLGISERLTAFKKHHDLNHCADVYVIPANVCLCKESSAHETLLQQIKSINNIGLIVIDTLARAMGSGDENSPSDMGSFVQNCDIIRQKSHAHLMVIHHSGKDESRGSRGHSSLKGAIDTEIQVKQSDGVISSTIVKQREGKKDIAFSFTLKEYEVRRDEDDEPVYSCALTPADTKSKAKPLSGQTLKGYNILIDLELEAGFPCKPRKGMKAQTVVRIDDFRQHCVKANLCKSDKTDSFDKAFKRLRENLETQGHTAEWEGHIWRTDKTDK